MDSRRKNLTGDILRVEEGSTEGKGKMQERQDLADGICKVVEAVMGDFTKMIMNFLQELKSYIV